MTFLYCDPCGDSLLSNRKNSEASNLPNEVAVRAATAASNAGWGRGTWNRPRVRCGENARSSRAKLIFSMAVSMRAASSASAGGAAIPAQKMRGFRVWGKNPKPFTSMGNGPNGPSRVSASTTCLVCASEISPRNLRVRWMPSGRDQRASGAALRKLRCASANAAGRGSGRSRAMKARMVGYRELGRSGLATRELGSSGQGIRDKGRGSLVPCNLNFQSKT